MSFGFNKSNIFYLKLKLNVRYSYIEVERFDLIEGGKFVEERCVFLIDDSSNCVLL